MHTTHIRLAIGTVMCATLCAMTLTVSAQETQGGAPGEQVRMNTEAREDMRAERRQTLETRAQDRIINLGSNVHQRLIAIHERMLDIIERLETRIEKLKAIGTNTESAEAKLLEAKNTLAEARTELTKIGSLEYVARGDTPRESFAVARQHFLTARDMIRTVHSLLRETIALLKDAVRGGEEGNGASPAVSQEEATIAE